MSFSARIVEHFTNPQNAGEMDSPDVIAFVGNPVCGDQIHLYARIIDDRITDCTFLAYGCTASLATASILTTELKAKSLDEIAALDEAQMVTMVGGLTPSQRHCATLARDVVQSLVHNYRTGSTQGIPGSPQTCQ